ncbi:hypothetical protein EJ04DRAFT_493376 [Polyplosphaeria fusca]|uniref:tRNA/rRNA methyltransferase SpoU type domain-containing protein n=1 Tax=Polyplosphaeria fusca TaxID=682080 RepID=A0A9P4R0C2_9PLEO|nr:hypothetical protein EJ04DRAFT_493376 [Polyplosphaeria fusca]
MAAFVLAGFDPAGDDFPSISSNSGTVFRTWFRIVSALEASREKYTGLYTDIYWARLRHGLLVGFAEQRKYCLGIIQRSIRIARQDIHTPSMTLFLGMRRSYEEQYARYSNLFETIVLDRYANQVQACTPELTKLFGSGSLIASDWTKTLLSCALSSKVQDGVRKIIGLWYMRFVLDNEGSIISHTDFLVDGFLSWATQGSLFTSTLTSTREQTTCAHGEALANVICRFLVEMPGASERRGVFTQVLRFVIGRGGRIFQYSILYLLQGLLEGCSTLESFEDLGENELDLLLQVSRLPGFPEAAIGLCVAYCGEFCKRFMPTDNLEAVPGYRDFSRRYEQLARDANVDFDKSIEHLDLDKLTLSNSPSLESFLQLHDPEHRAIQGDNFVPTCTVVSRVLDRVTPKYYDLCVVLEALWDEAERQDFRRQALLKLPHLFFHSTVLRALAQHRVNYPGGGESLTPFLTKALERLGEIAEGRTYLLPQLVEALRHACYHVPEILEVLPIDDLFARLVENPPLPKKEFLFEAAAAEKLQLFQPHRDYDYYYGNREWCAYAALIDLVNSFPKGHLHVAECILKRLLEPWSNQQAPIPVIGKWKGTFQLQTMLLLVDLCMSEEDATWYHESFFKALVVEQWPRYRFFLEWAISRIQYRYPSLAFRSLKRLAEIDEADPRHVASIMKVAVLSCQFLPLEEFALKLMLQLIPLSASQKAQIRHEAHWSFPIVFQVAEQAKWKAITDNPAFSMLNDHIRKVNRFSSYPASIRFLELNVVKHFTIFNIFQGDYLKLENSEQEMFTVGDIEQLREIDERTGWEVLPFRIALDGARLAVPGSSEETADVGKSVSSSEEVAFQTKAGFDLDALLASTEPQETIQKRPSSVILIASLIDNPTNLGGLSRIAESFGFEALYIDSLKHTASKEFQATAVTSHKHLPIEELKANKVPDYIVELQQEGYQVVAIEQTDRSNVLGEGLRLPRKCVLVLGSEKGGVPPEVLAVVDRCVEIKTVGVTRSLNVQTAAGIVAYDWWRSWGKVVERPE